MPTINKFVETILNAVDFEPTEIIVTIDIKLYSCDYGINVKPLLVIVKNKNESKTKTFNISSLMELFKTHKLYLLVKENKYRRLSRDPQNMIIDPVVKEFEEHKYYKYSIQKLFLMDEIEKYQKIRSKALEILKSINEDAKKAELPPELLE